MCHGPAPEAIRNPLLSLAQDENRSGDLSRDFLTERLSFSASCHMYLVSIYDRSMIKASIVNHPFKEIKSVLHSRITSGNNALRRGQSSLVSYDSNKERPSPDIN
jgi:hypothetical protein